MTEAEWLAGEDSYPLSLHIVKGSARKLRLFAVACARRVPAELITDDCRRLVDASEASAEDQITPPQRRKFEKPVADLAQQHEEAWRRALHADDFTSLAYRRYKAISASGMTSQANRFLIRSAADEVANSTLDPVAEKRCQCDLLRDIYGNPFQPVNLDPQLKSEKVVELAKAIESSWNLSAFGGLASALINAGCDHTQILDHCRGSGPHVRGCWVIDLILDKK